MAWRHRANSIGFVALVAIVVLSPLPFGANRPFFWFLFSSLVGLLLIWWGVGAVAARAPGGTVPVVPLARYWREALLTAALGLWFLIQAAAWTPETLHHPVWAATALLTTEVHSEFHSGVHSAISATPDETMDAWVRFLAYGGTFFLAMQYGRDPKHARLALWSVAVAGLVYGGYGLIIYFGNFQTILWYQRWAYADSLTATFVNRNSFAAFGGMTLVCSLALLSSVERRAGAFIVREGRGAYLERLAGHGLLLLVGAIVILTAVLLSHSRAGLLATALGCTAYYFCRRRAKRGTDRRSEGAERRSGDRKDDERRRGDWRSWQAITPLVLAITMIFVIIFSGAATWQRVDRNSLTDAGVRLAIYDATLTGIFDRPLFGHGMGSYRHVFEAYRTPELTRVATLDKAHNSYLEFAFEAGIPALLVLMAIFASLFVRCVLGARRRQRDSMYPAVAVGTATLLAAHSLVDFSLQIPAITFLFLFGIGFAQSWSSRDS